VFISPFWNPMAPLPNHAQPRVAVVMTVFNRRDTTLRCLRSVAGQARESSRFTIYVVDDASTDGTREAVAAEFPDVRLIKGNGQLYWNGGMSLALDNAYRDGHDFYWWLNDDVALDSDAFDRLLETAGIIDDGDAQPGIVVGTLRDPEDGSLTYGGVSRLHPLKRTDFSLIAPGDHPVPAETMNGNCVLVSQAVAAGVGNLTPDYRQKMGDYDYGLRARQAGFEVIVAPGTFGTCARHDEYAGSSSDPTGRLSDIWSVKELEFGTWGLFCRRWAGPLWPMYFASPYVKRGARLLLNRVRAGFAPETDQSEEPDAPSRMT